MIKKYFALIVIIFFTSCQSKTSIPSSILKPEKMQTVLWDILRADAFTFNFIKKDSSKNLLAENVKLQQQIFAVHKTSQQQFYASLDYYKTHTDIMQPLLDSLINKANKEKYSNTKGKQWNDTLTRKKYE